MDGVIGVFSGRSLPANVSTDTGLLRLTFASDATVAGAGWVAAYNATRAPKAALPDCAPGARLVQVALRTRADGAEAAWALYPKSPPGARAAMAGGLLPAAAAAALPAEVKEAPSYWPEYKSLRSYFSYGCLAPGDYIIKMYDSYGDGWAGGRLSLALLADGAGGRGSQECAVLSETVTTIEASAEFTLRPAAAPGAADGSAAGDTAAAAAAAAAAATDCTAAQAAGASAHFVAARLAVAGEAPGAFTLSKQKRLKDALALVLGVDVSQVGVLGWAQAAAARGGSGGGSTSSGARRGGAGGAADPAAEVSGGAEQAVVPASRRHRQLLGAEGDGGRRSVAAAIADEAAAARGGGARALLAAMRPLGELAAEGAFASPEDLVRLAAAPEAGGDDGGSGSGKQQLRQQRRRLQLLVVGDGGALEPLAANATSADGVMHALASRVAAGPRDDDVVDGGSGGGAGGSGDEEEQLWAAAEPGGGDSGADALLASSSSGAAGGLGPAPVGPQPPVVAAAMVAGVDGGASGGSGGGARASDGKVVAAAVAGRRPAPELRILTAPKGFKARGGAAGGGTNATGPPPAVVAGGEWRAGSFARAVPRQGLDAAAAAALVGERVGRAKSVPRAGGGADGAGDGSGGAAVRAYAAAATGLGRAAAAVPASATEQAAARRTRRRLQMLVVGDDGSLEPIEAASGGAAVNFESLAAARLPAAGAVAPALEAAPATHIASAAAAVWRVPAAAAPPGRPALAEVGAAAPPPLVAPGGFKGAEAAAGGGPAWQPGTYGARVPPGGFTRDEAEALLAGRLGHGRLGDPTAGAYGDATTPPPLPLPPHAYGGRALLQAERVGGRDAAWAAALKRMATPETIRIGAVFRRGGGDDDDAAGGAQALPSTPAAAAAAKRHRRPRPAAGRALQQAGAPPSMSADLAVDLKITGLASKAQAGQVADALGGAVADGTLADTLAAQGWRVDRGALSLLSIGVGDAARAARGLQLTPLQRAAVIAAAVGAAGLVLATCLGCLVARRLRRAAAAQSAAAQIIAAHPASIPSFGPDLFTHGAFARPDSKTAAYEAAAAPPLGGQYPHQQQQQQQQLQYPPAGYASAAGGGVHGGGAVMGPAVFPAGLGGADGFVAVSAAGGGGLGGGGSPVPQVTTASPPPLLAPGQRQGAQLQQPHYPQQPLQQQALQPPEPGWLGGGAPGGSGYPRGW